MVGVDDGRWLIPLQWLRRCRCNGMEWLQLVAYFLLILLGFLTYVYVYACIYLLILWYANVRSFMGRYD